MSHREIAHEERRIRDAYRRYAISPKEQAKRDLKVPGNLAMVQERDKAIASVIARYGSTRLASAKILDVGCGGGDNLGKIEDLGAAAANLYGVDLLPRRIEVAVQNYPGFNFSCGNAERLQFDDSTFDLVMTFTLFSSILSDRMARNVAGEIHRVLKPGGAVLWYDFRYNNPYNPDIRCITRRHIQELFFGFRVEVQSLILLPPLARWLGRWTPVFYPLLVSIPVLRSHYLGLILKPGAA